MTPEQAIQEFGLPPELVDFLQQGHQFDYDSRDCEPGKVTLRPLTELTIRKAWIDPSELQNYAVWNPHGKQDGYYEIPCVSLSKSAERYDPDGILIWIPKYRIFASCDAGHGVIWVFLGAAWEKIVSDPTTFLGAQWNVNPEVQALLVPWGLFQFREGNPYDDQEAITA